MAAGRPAAPHRPRAAEDSAAGARNPLLRPGFTIGDTSLVLYFDAAGPGVTDWTTWYATVYDPDTGTAQQSTPQAGADTPACGAPRQYCRSLGSADGWSLKDGHHYFATLTVTLKDGTQVVSDTDTDQARATAVPPALPAAQAIGCSCNDALAPTAFGQALRGSNVNTGTGTFTLSGTDLQMTGLGVPFQAVRRYSSGNTGAGSLGVGWSWSYDVRVFPPAQGGGAVTVRAEDGAQAVYRHAADGSYQRPPGVRSGLSTVAGGWRLLTPSQISYLFDGTGRLTSVKNPRGQGVSISYGPSSWTLTDAAGRQVDVRLNQDGLIRAITCRTAGPPATAIRTGSSRGDRRAARGLGLPVRPRAAERAAGPARAGAGRQHLQRRRVVRQSDAEGQVTTFSWDPGKQEATTVDPDGVTTYDGYRDNVLLYSQNGNGDTANHRYDTALNPSLLIDPWATSTPGPSTATATCSPRPSRSRSARPSPTATTSTTTSARTPTRSATPRPSATPPSTS
ncbi:hypothetical protein GXW82_17940 [Streptacidiphilus sp. 4-A2]|nr:hypothetical protein [Streptacidiphilus sp. 4-A2]